MRRDRGGRGVVEEKDGERRWRGMGRGGAKRREKSTEVQSAGVRAVRRNAGSAMKTSNQGSTLQCTVYFSLSIYHQFIINYSSHSYIFIYIFKRKGKKRWFVEILKVIFSMICHNYAFNFCRSMTSKKRNLCTEYIIQGIKFFPFFDLIL